MGGAMKITQAFTISFALAIACVFTGCSKKERTVAGTLIGAGAGVGIGAATGGVGAAVAGGVVGGVLGGVIGNKTAKE